jgi:hypothetical protein
MKFDIVTPWVTAHSEKAMHLGIKVAGLYRAVRRLLVIHASVVSKFSMVLLARHLCPASDIFKN